MMRALVLPAILGLLWILPAPVHSLTRAFHADAPGRPVEIRSLEVHTRISPWFAETTLDYVLVSPERGAEAVVEFSLPEAAVVTGVSLSNDGMLRGSRALERLAAVHGYERGRATQGRTTSLGDVRSGLFRLRTTLLSSDDDAATSRHVTMRYLEPLQRTPRAWRWRLPLESGASLPVGLIIARVEVAADAPVEVVVSTNDPLVEIDRPDALTASILYADEVVDPPRDLVIEIRPDLDNELPVTVSDAPVGDRDGFFALWIPPRWLPAAPLPSARNVTFLVDVSSSMADRRLKLVDRAIGEAVRSLPAGSRFNLVTFANRATSFSATMQPVDAATVAQAQAWLGSVELGGATDLGAALMLARDLSASVSLEHDLVVITDGAPTLGLVAATDLLPIARSAGTRLHAVGLGPHVDWSLLGALATSAGGRAVYFGSDDRADDQLGETLTRLLTDALHDVDFELQGTTATAICPVLATPAGSGLARFGRYGDGGPVAARIGVEDASITVDGSLAERVAATEPELDPFYLEEFDDGAPGWRMLPGGEGWWTSDTTAGLYQVRDLDGESLSYYTEPILSDQYTIDARMRLGSWEGKVTYSHADKNGAYRIDLMASHQMARLQTTEGLHHVPFPLESGRWYDVRVVVDDGLISTWIDGRIAHDRVPFGDGDRPDGWFGIGSYGPTHDTDFDYVHVYRGAVHASPVPPPGPIALLWAQQKVSALLGGLPVSPAPVDESQILLTGYEFDIATPFTSLLVPEGALLSAPVPVPQEPTRTAITRDAELATTPSDLVLAPNYPNPFNASTVIPFHLPPGAGARLSVYNLSGQRVRHVDLAPGTTSWTWNGRDAAGRDVASGLYLVRLEAGLLTATHRLLLLR